MNTNKGIDGNKLDRRKEVISVVVVWYVVQRSRSKLYIFRDTNAKNKKHLNMIIANINPS